MSNLEIFTCSDESSSMVFIPKTVSNGYGVFRIREIFICSKLHFVTQTIFGLYRVWGYKTPHLPQNYSVRYTVFTVGHDEAAAFMTPFAKDCNFCTFV